MKQLVFVTLATVVIVMGVTSLFRKTESHGTVSDRPALVADSHPTTESSESAAEVAAAAKERANLARSLVELQRRVDTLSNRDLAQPTVATEESTPDAKPKTNAEVERELREELDATLESEKRDAPWADAAEAEVQHLFAATSEDAQVLAVRCGTTLCRSELSANDLQAHQHFIAEFTSELRWPGAGYIYAAEVDGQPRTIVYLTKPGIELPENSRLD